MWNHNMDRRTFLGVGAGMAGLAMSAPASPIPIIDTHIHLFDTRRPQGVPWPPKNDKIYQPALPDRYRRLTESMGVVGAIEVECSNWLEDNQWVLDVEAANPIMVGMVGDLEVGQPGFRENLERFHRNPLFLGIRYGNLWGRNLGEGLSKPEFVSDLQALAGAGLEMDIAQPDAALIADVIRLTDRVPRLRVVVDHLPFFDPPQEPQARRTWEGSFRELAKRPQVYIKVSEVLHPIAGQIHTDLDFYRPRLDEFWDIFGEDRLMYGSDWPNSDHFATYPQVLSVVREYFGGKGRAVAEKFFWKNSVAVYRWVKRQNTQPQAILS
jgi:predicted TIM-barrel fold metal-dependent hydrolase